VDYPEGRTQRWAYDGTGQRLSEIEALPSQTPDTTLYHYTRDRLDSTTGEVAQTFAYDANGSMTRKGMETFRYDAKLRLQQVQASGEPLNVFTYDPMGLRVQTVNSEGKTAYLIDPSSNMGQFNTMSVSAEYKNGAKSREFGLGTRPDEVLWEENGEGLFYLLYDGLGSVVALTNTSGNVVGQMAYDAFGKVFSQSGQAGDVRYGYTGRPMDKDIGLQYNRARFYDAGNGRWNRSDEYRGEIAVPASLQRYVYVNQSPISFADPSGNSIDEYLCDYSELSFIERVLIAVLIELVVVILTLIAIYLAIEAIAATGLTFAGSSIYLNGARIFAIESHPLSMGILRNAGAYRKLAGLLRVEKIWHINIGLGESSHIIIDPKFWLPIFRKWFIDLFS
jgi:RHS repeat-associated protein